MNRKDRPKGANYAEKYDIHNHGKQPSKITATGSSSSNTNNNINNKSKKNIQSNANGNVGKINMYKEFNFDEVPDFDDDIPVASKQPKYKASDSRQTGNTDGYDDDDEDEWNQVSSHQQSNVQHYKNGSVIDYYDSRQPKDDEIIKYDEPKHVPSLKDECRYIDDESYNNNNTNYAYDSNNNNRQQPNHKINRGNGKRAQVINSPPYKIPELPISVQKKKARELIDVIQAESRIMTPASAPSNPSSFSRNNLGTSGTEGGGEDWSDDETSRYQDTPYNHHDDYDQCDDLENELMNLDFQFKAPKANKQQYNLAGGNMNQIKNSYITKPITKKQPPVALSNVPSLPYELSKMSSEASSNPKEKLYYSKQPREIEYKPYTLQQYKLIKPKDYVEISNIKPDLNTDELRAKRANLERIKEFGRNLRNFNQNILESQPKMPNGNEAHDLDVAKKQQESKRQRGLQFARNIPIPKVASTNANSSNNRGDSDDNAYMNITHEQYGMESKKAKRLEDLEAKYADSKRNVESIKKSIGI